MKKEKDDFKEFESLLNEKGFFEAVEDAFIMADLKKPSEYSDEIKNLEKNMYELIDDKNKTAFEVLLTNYNRYFYKHIISYHKNREDKMFKKGLELGESLAKNKKQKKD